MIAWADGGLTNLDSLIGVCNRTHIAIHQGLLHIEPKTLKTTRTRSLLRRRSWMNAA